MPTTIIYVRHGENPANLTHQLSHRVVDHSLTDRGRRQAMLLAAHLAAGHEGRIDAVFSSPLRRARETADAIGAALRQPVRIIESLREFDVGDLDGRADEEAWRLHDAVFHAWLERRSDVAFAGGESLPALLARSTDALREVARRVPQGRAVVVGHGGILRISIANLFLDSFDVATVERIGNCSITEMSVEVGADGAIVGRVIGCGRVDHLAELDADLAAG